jgi:hypothetical protein
VTDLLKSSASNVNRVAVSIVQLKVRAGRCVLNSDFRAAMLNEHKEHLCPGRGAAAVQDASRAKNVVAGLNASPVALNLSRDDVQVFVTIGMTVRFIAPA